MNRTPPPNSQRTRTSGNERQRPEREPASPRRQARGQRRIDQLLDAADTVFAQVGYERATTNAVCKQAGVSPGTLYQFFPHKHAMAEALAARYLERLPHTHQAAFDLASTNGPLADIIAHVVDPFISLHRQMPGLEALLTGSVISEELTATIDGLKQHVEKSLVALFLARCPKANRAEINRAAATSVQLVKAFLHFAVAGTPKQQKDGIQELKTVLFRYLEPLLGE